MYRASRWRQRSEIRRAWRVAPTVRAWVVDPCVSEFGFRSMEPADERYRWVTRVFEVLALVSACYVISHSRLWLRLREGGNPFTDPYQFPPAE
ncbi:hypothetical protein MPTK1_3g20660 [Marchantia polymorpha subsp. ruderalis]|uniref:Uncharacterized protein n=2 Tax=Marchantia polymorpha TaxID=3197 RepID=A0AAF6B300_MARPO|nr:hypothetical protein MARPO_0149s0032 [Marchantia polymorpha]BBN06384.1 hypothetical protein Mp_3g20660 [Marchantia polymorpha subsp. ruderalis]|eukprot:PTQ29040.1 hypothetical protein MARPO_0149s0032 [Marchantia polymorpha]